MPSRFALISMGLRSPRPVKTRSYSTLFRELRPTPAGSDLVQITEFAGRVVRHGLGAALISQPAVAERVRLVVLAEGVVELDGVGARDGESRSWLPSASALPRSSRRSAERCRARIVVFTYCRRTRRRRAVVM